MIKPIFIKRIKNIKLRADLVLLTLILVLVAIPYAPKAYRALSDWKKENDRIARNSELIKSENETRKKQQQLLQRYGISHLELYDNAVSYLQAETRIKELKAKYSSCESPISPIPTTKPKSNYFDIDFEKFKPSSSKTEYEQFISDCIYIKEYKTNFNLFDSEISKLNLLISENINSTDRDIQLFAQSLSVKVKNYQHRALELKPLVIEQKDLEGYYRVYKNPFVLYLRKALNAYLANDSSEVNISMAAVEKGNSDGIISGLDAFEKDYYKSKFIVLSINDSLGGGKDIQMIFQDKPDRIFYAWVYKLAGGNYELRGFNSKEHFDENEIKEMIDYYKSYLFDKEHAL